MNWFDLIGETALVLSAMEERDRGKGMRALRDGCDALIEFKEKP